MPFKIKALFKVSSIHKSLLFKQQQLVSKSRTTIEILWWKPKYHSRFAVSLGCLHFYKKSQNYIFNSPCCAIIPPTVSSSPRVHSRIFLSPPSAWHQAGPECAPPRPAPHYALAGCVPPQECTLLPPCHWTDAHGRTSCWLSWASWVSGSLSSGSQLWAVGGRTLLPRLWAEI